MKRQKGIQAGATLSCVAEFRLFAYGTLQLSDVMRTVSGGDFSAQPACLEGYARYCLGNLVYPGLRREAGGMTEGVLYSGLDETALGRLDEFEDWFYQRIQVTVRLATGEHFLAEAYVIPPEHDGLFVMKSWSLQKFRRENLQGLLADL